MIRIQLKKKFETKTEAWRYLLSIVHPGDETYFEAVGNKTKQSNVVNFADDLKELGLEPVD